MTAQRQERNGSRPGIGFRPGIAFIALLAGLLSLGAPAWLPVAAQASTTERVVVNRYSGLAIEGFDPVAYFADARAMVGLPDFEASEAGTAQPISAASATAARRVAKVIKPPAIEIRPRP